MHKYCFRAKVIEKHFTINKKLRGPDQLASILPKEFSEMVAAVNKSVLILGKNEKNAKMKRNKCQKFLEKALLLTKI